MMRWSLGGLVVACLAAPIPAAGHIGNLPGVALPLKPECAGSVVDHSYVVDWFDRDTEEPEGFEPTFIDWFATAQMPPTFYPWDRPNIDGSVEIALDVPLSDPANSLVWDTSALSGVYWVYSVTLDRDFELTAIAPGPVTIAREGDPVPPSINFVQSDATPEIADQAKDLEYCAHDPDGTGVVTISVTDQLDGSDLRVVAAGLSPADGSVEWDTSRVKEGDWMVHAKIEDARGHGATAWGRYFVRVYHLQATEGEGEGAQGEGMEGEGDGAGEGEGEGTEGEGSDRCSPERAGGVGECAGDGGGVPGDSDSGCASAGGWWTLPPPRR